MKKIFLLLLISLFTANSFAQVSSDSLAYQAQRKKINSMLAARKQKFDQYDQSLTRHTGIFGLQTKKDIKTSNDILMNIIKTDDDIFVQTKILLDYRTFQQNEAISHSSETESTNVGFMNTINKLQEQNEKLKQQLAATGLEWQQSKQRSLWLIVGLLIIVIYLLRLKFVKKSV